MALGFAGVTWLASGKASVRDDGTLWALAAGLAATLSYGFAANITKRLFTDVPSRAVAAGTQTAAALMLAPLAWSFWPAASPGVRDWAAAGALGVFCTGLAYLLYFRLLARVGASKAIAVTFLIPAFAMLWGGLFLGEQISVPMLGGCAVILAGTALATGLVPRR
jgi:drug/metabolite transporter (DMT)-like permease